MAKLDDNFHLFMTNEEIYEAGGWGWYQEQLKIVENNQRLLDGRHDDE